MTTEAHTTLAFVYKRSGKNILTKSELVNILSIELTWFTPKQAQTFVTHALDTLLLKETKNGLTPTFDIHTINIPLGFKPHSPTPSQPTSSAPAQKEAPNSLIDELITRIAHTTNKTPETIKKQINQLQEDKKIHPEIAALLLAHQHQIPTQDLHTTLKKSIFTAKNVK